MIEYIVFIIIIILLLALRIHNIETVILGMTVPSICSPVPSVNCNCGIWMCIVGLSNKTVIII